jgi:hypothetical protein
LTASVTRCLASPPAEATFSIASKAREPNTGMLLGKITFQLAQYSSVSQSIDDK